MTEVTCNLFKPISGKWYGEHTFMIRSELLFQLTNESVISECGMSYTRPESFLIHVSHKSLQWIIIPK